VKGCSEIVPEMDDCALCKDVDVRMWT
jgi:hypothetical protein